MQNSGDLSLQREKMDEKSVLLEEVTPHIQTHSISISIIKNLILAIAFAFALFLPKIYISSQIYLSSVKINKKLNEYYSLKAENSILLSKIEKIKFKNRLNIDSF